LTQSGHLWGHPAPSVAPYVTLDDRLNVLPLSNLSEAGAAVRRRDFIKAIAGSTAAWPLPARAQQTVMPVVGFLSSRSPNESAGVITAFKQGLQEQGFIEGQNVVIAFRWAEGAYDRLPALAADLVNLKVAVLFAAGGPPAAVAAKAATSAIPIVFSAVNNPDRLGLVAGFNRPGGNVTGMSTFTIDVGAKSVELLRELVPRTAVMAYLVNPSNPTVEFYTKEATRAASALGIQIRVLNASTEGDLDEAFSALAGLGATGLVVLGEPFFESKRDKIVALANRHAIPTIYGFREYVTAGGLMSYGASLPDSYRRAGIYVGRIIKGEKPADLPVMQPTKFDLVINLKTAKALGITVPQSLLVAADEVIE
jgi:putative tryptophan/tyrosine transport system substrate-binding protein